MDLIITLKNKESITLLDVGEVNFYSGGYLEVSNQDDDVILTIRNTEIEQFTYRIKDLTKN